EAVFRSAHLPAHVHAAPAGFSSPPFAWLAFAAIIRRCWLRNRARGPRAPIYSRVCLGGLGPGENLAHRSPRELGEPRAILVEPDATLHRLIERLGTVSVVQDTGDTVLNRVGKTTHPPRDWERAVQL